MAKLEVKMKQVFKKLEIEEHWGEAGYPALWPQGIWPPEVPSEKEIDVAATKKKKIDAKN